MHAAERQNLNCEQKEISSVYTSWQASTQETKASTEVNYFKKKLHICEYISYGFSLRFEQKHNN